MRSRELVTRSLEFNRPARIPRLMGLLPWATTHHGAEVRRIQKRFPDDTRDIGPWGEGIRARVHSEQNREWLPAPRSYGLQSPAPTTVEPGAGTSEGDAETDESDSETEESEASPSPSAEEAGEAPPPPADAEEGTQEAPGSEESVQPEESAETPDEPTPTAPDASTAEDPPGEGS